MPTDDGDDDGGGAADDDAGNGKVTDFSLKASTFLSSLASFTPSSLEQDTTNIINVCSKITFVL